MEGYDWTQVQASICNWGGMKTYNGNFDQFFRVSAPMAKW